MIFCAERLFFLSEVFEAPNWSPSCLQLQGLYANAARNGSRTGKAASK